MFKYSANIVRILQDGTTDDHLSQLADRIESRELEIANHRLKKLFKDIKRLLNHSFNHFDKIMALDPDSLSQDQAQEVQKKSDLIHRNLFRAACLFGDIRTELSYKDIELNEAQEENYSGLNQDLQILMYMYEASMDEDHITAQRIDTPQIALLGLDNPAPHHHEFTRQALQFFTYLGEKPRDPSLKDHWRILEYGYFPYFLSLQESCRDQVDLLVNDYREFLATGGKDYDPKKYPYIESLKEEMSRLLQMEIDSQTILKALADDEFYNRVKTNFIDGISSMARARFSDAVKPVLTLHAAKVKLISQEPGDHDNIPAHQDAKFLGFDDIEALQRVLVNEVHRLALNYIKSSAAMILPMPALTVDGSNPLAQYLQFLVKDKDLNYRAHELKREFEDPKRFAKAFEDPYSPTRQLMDDYSLIFLKAGIEPRDLMQLKSKTNDEALVPLFRKIRTVAMRQSTIDKKEAIGLIYLLAKAYGKNTRISFIPKTIGPLVRYLRSSPGLIRLSELPDNDSDKKDRI